LDVALLAQEHHASADALWAHLHERSGLRQRVLGLCLGDVERGEALLRRWAGYEDELLQRLANRLHAHAVDERAEWVRLDSEKYPGRVFYFNNQTQQSVWAAPEGVVFRRVKVLRDRARDVGTVLVRGDLVAVVVVAGAVGAAHR
jgi:hypothetical protein